MWNKLSTTEYFLSFADDLELCVTDFISIWRLQFSEESFLACLKDSNMDMEIDPNELVQNGKQILTRPGKLKSSKEEENTLELRMTMSFGYPLKLHMKLTKGSKELFFSKVTLSLLKTIQDLHTSQQELRDLLHKKDLEIEEYKCEGGEIALRFLKTIPFNDEVHMSKHVVCDAHFGPAAVPACLLHKAVDVPETRVMKAEPTVVDVKQESPETRTQVQVKAEPSRGSQVKTEPRTDVKREENSTAVKRESPAQVKVEQTHSPARKLRKKLNL